MKIAVVGLGYVGLPLAVAFDQKYDVVGIDINKERIKELKQGYDRTNEISREELQSCNVEFVCDFLDVADSDYVIVTVPTPVDKINRPDLFPLEAATKSIGRFLSSYKKTTVVYESTVYPGATENICGPILEVISGLVRGEDFFIAYSPERINPGDKEHTFKNINKVVAGENPQITEEVAALYEAVINAEIFKAKNIRTAEAAKVIENAQRDLNIAFMNELSQIFRRMDISIHDVLEAANTKWNFLPFQPGLVGGHCIGVDPYYLSHAAHAVGYHPKIILAGRNINESMATVIADSIHSEVSTGPGAILILGCTFKEEVPDIRNSKVFDLIKRFQWLGWDVTVHDPMADAAEVEREHGVTLSENTFSRPYDVVIGAVSHSCYECLTACDLEALVKKGGVLADIKGMWRSLEVDSSIKRWSL